GDPLPCRLAAQGARCVGEGGDRGDLREGALEVQSRGTQVGAPQGVARMTAPKLEAKTAHLDPYRNFRSKMKWDGNDVGSFTKVSGLTHPTQPVKHREGGDAAVRLAPGQTEFMPITLERGITHDVGFEQWANKVWDFRPSDTGRPVESLQDFHRDIAIELF